jgi:hypothetical protein
MLVCWLVYPCLCRSPRLLNSFSQKEHFKFEWPAGWVGIGGSSYKQCSINYTKNTFLESSKDNNNNSLRTFFPQESLVLVYHIQRGRIFFLVCLFGCLFVFALCIFVCVSLSLVVLCVIGCCHTYFLKRSSECPLISFDKDQPNTILSQWLRTTWEVPLHLDLG